jgi:hypothetical protein
MSHAHGFSRQWKQKKGGDAGITFVFDRLEQDAGGCSDVMLDFFSIRSMLYMI